MTIVKEVKVSLNNDHLKVLTNHSIVYDVDKGWALTHALALLAMFDKTTAKGGKMLIENKNGEMLEITL